MISPQQRRLTVALWAVLVLVLAGVIGASVWSRFRDDGRTDTATLPVLFDAPDFALTTESGRAMTSSELRGHVYVADFIFTQCGGPCPLMTQEMARLQKSVTDRSVRFVSFSVDPDHDTPAVLKEYARDKAGADPARWSFLTGDHRAIFDVARGMKITAEVNPQGVLHATYFLLVDGAGHVRGVYDAQGESAAPRLKQLVEDINKLTGESSKPAATGGGRAS